MSKQSDAKAAQNYRREPDNCSACKHFVCDIEEYPDYWDKTKILTKQKNLRCGIGGFKIHLTAVCDQFSRKES